MKPAQALAVLVLILVALVGGWWLVSGTPDAPEVAGAVPASGPAPAETGGEAADLATPAELDEGSGRTARVGTELAPEVAVEDDAAPAAARGGPRLVGTVLDDAGRPIEGADVHYARDLGFGFALPIENDDTDWVGRRSAVSDAEGRFAITGHEPGRARIAVRAAGFAPFDARELTIPSGELFELEPITLEQSVVLAGRVVDSIGRGVLGAEIQRLPGSNVSLRFFGNSRGAGVTVARTEPDGTFTIDQLASGPYTLRVVTEDHPDAIEKGVTQRPGERVGGIVIALEDGFEIHGRVVGAPAEARGQLSVRAAPHYGERDGDMVLQLEQGEIPAESRTAEVDDAGGFVLRGLREGRTYALTARRDLDGGGRIVFGRSSVSERVLAQSGDRGVEVAYRPEAAIVFQVVDADTREPVTEYEVDGGVGWPVPLLSDAGGRLREHPEGRARFGGLRPQSNGDTAELEIRATGYRTLNLDGIALVTGQETDLGQIALEPVPLLRVTVSDANGAPVAGARVRLAKAAEPTEGSFERRINRRVEINDSGTSVELTDGETRTATTNASGVATLTSFEGERCKLTVTHADFALASPEPFVAAVGVNESRAVQLSAGGRVTVTLVDPDGEPVPGRPVEHRRPGSEAPAGMPMPVFGAGGGPVSDAEGVVVLVHLEPGSHAFRPGSSPRGGVFTTGGGDFVAVRGGPERDGPEWTDVIVTEGGEAAITLVVPREVALFGRVTEDGQALAGATVRLEKPGDDSPHGAMFGGGGPSARTDGNGDFRLEGIEAGEYTLSVRHVDRVMPAEFDVRIADEDRRFDVDLAVATIAGRVTDEDGEGLAGVRVWPERAAAEGAPQQRTMMVMAFASDSGDTVTIEDGSGPREDTTTDADGFYELRGVLPDVDLVVKAEGEGVRPGTSERVNVVPGDTRNGVDLALGIAGEALVRAVNADGTPGKNLIVIATYEGEETGVDRKTAFIRSSGETTLTGLVPGPWRINLRAIGIGGGETPTIPEQTIDVPGGETAEAVFEVP